MDLRRVAAILRKDLRLGPRSPLLLWALVIPLLLTVLVRGVFGELFAGEPRLGVVDEGDSAVVEVLRDLGGVRLTLLDDPDELADLVADHRLDAGLVLPVGVDDRVRAGEAPAIRAWLAGGSGPEARALVLVRTLEAFRTVAGDVSTVEVTFEELGDTSLPLDLRLLPLLVMYAVAIPGGMVPASSLVEEKERGTLASLLATPTSMREVLFAKGLLGVLLAVAAGLATLLLNDAFGVSPTAVVLAVLVGATMMASIGLVMGAWSPDMTTMFTAWKAGGMVIFLPAIFFIWPQLPSWPGRLMPAWYFLHPAYAVGVEGAGLTDVAGELAIGAGIVLALVPVVLAAGRRAERRLFAGAPTRR